MGAAVTMRIPAYLRYALQPDLSIATLQAYWELPAMVGQFLRTGPRAVPAGIQLAGALLRNQGPTGAVGFASGLAGAGARGKRAVTHLLDGLCAGDEVAVRRHLTRDTAVLSGDDTPLAASGLLRRCDGAGWSKLITSGHSLVARLDRDGRRAVLIAELSPKTLAVSRLRYFTDAG